MNGTEFARISGSYSTAFIGTYEQTSQSTSGNYTVFKLRAYFYYGGGTKVSSSTSGGFYLDGTLVHDGNYSNLTPGYYLWGEKSITVYHNSDGSFPGRSVSISGKSYHIDGSKSGNLSASTIPRYATITTHQIEETKQDSIKVKWGTDVARSQTQYSLNGGSWTETSGSVASDNKSGTYVISGLNSGTTYTIKTRVKRTDSGLWTVSGTLTATTKDYVVRLNVNGTWKKGIPYLNVNGTWKKGIPYLNVNGTWKKGI